LACVGIGKKTRSASTPHLAVAPFDYVNTI
jgi:hypothetical protein